MYQLFLYKHINNKIPKTGTAKQDKTENTDFYHSFDNAAHSEVLARMKLKFS